MLIRSSDESAWEDGNGLFLKHTGIGTIVKDRVPERKRLIRIVHSSKRLSRNSIMRGQKSQQRVVLQVSCTRDGLEIRYVEVPGSIHG